MSDESETQAETEEQEDAPGTTSGRPTPPPYPSQRVRTTHRSTQPETPYARVTPPPPAPNEYHDRVPEVPPPPPPASADDDWSVVTQPRIMSPPPAARSTTKNKPPLAPLAPLVPRPAAVPRPSSAPRSARPSPAPTSTPPLASAPQPSPSRPAAGASQPAPLASPPAPAPLPPEPKAPLASPPPPAPSEPPAPHNGALAASRAERTSLEVEVDPDWQAEAPTPPPVVATPAPAPRPESKPAGPPVQITAMRIIAIGAPPRVEEPIPVTTDDIEVTEQLDEADALVHALTAEQPADAEVSDDLLEEELPPESEPEPELEPPQASPSSPTSARPDAKPPPPPRRAMISAPAVDAEKERMLAAERARKAAEEAARKQRRAWWEVLFNEDFNRASARLSDEQIVREVNFIEESLGVATSGVVLDLGCGAGYHAVELAGRGYGVVGYDLSLFQLALAADVAQDRGTKLNLLQGDMREMAFEEMFDGIFCWNTSFGYFEEDKNVNVAQRIFRALRPGGMFLIDVANRDFVTMNQPSSVWYEGDACVCMDDMQMDFISSRMRVKRSLILDDGRTRECVYSIRLYTLHELGKLLHDVGFKVTEASGHPATPGVFFGQNSPRIIMLAERP